MEEIPVFAYQKHFDQDSLIFFLRLEKSELKPFLSNVDPFQPADSGLYRDISCLGNLDSHDKCVLLTAQGLLELSTLITNMSSTVKIMRTESFFSSKVWGARRVRLGSSLLAVETDEGFAVFDHRGTDFGFFESNKQVVGIASDELDREGILLRDKVSKAYEWVSIRTKPPLWRFKVKRTRSAGTKGKILVRSSSGLEVLDAAL